jgi:hypothetical protein
LSHYLDALINYLVNIFEQKYVVIDCFLGSYKNKLKGKAFGVVYAHRNTATHVTHIISRDR